MIEVNWDENAIEAVKAYYWWLGDDANCGLELDETLGKFMEKVVARKATKTVADAVEQESEKWTHVYTDDTGTDIRCVLLAEHDEWAWIKDAGTVDTIRKSWLKPIKPKLTKAQAWDKICESEHEFDIVNRIKQLYDII